MLAVGTRRAYLRLFDASTSAEKASVEPPEPFKTCELHYIKALSQTSLAVGFRAENETTPICVYDIEAKTYAKFNVGLQNAERPNMFHICHLPQWGVMAVGGSNFPEVEVLSNQSGNWQTCALEDSSKAQMPQDADYQDLNNLGMALDFTSKDRIKDESGKGSCGGFRMGLFCFGFCDQWSSFVNGFLCRSWIRRVKST